MSLDVLAWNVKDSFSDEARAAVVMDLIEAEQPDVAVFSEAYDESRDHLMSATQILFADKGYTTAYGSYDDDDGRKDRHGLLTIACQELEPLTKIVNLAGRSAMKLSVLDPISELLIDLYGVHLDDRSEQNRLVQAESLLELVDQETPAVIAGDLNNMHRQDRRALELRGLGLVSRLLPKPEHTTAGQKGFSLARMGGITGRLSAMASGITLKLLESADFVDADPSHAATWGARIPLAQLDHVMVRDLGVVDFQVLPYYPVSDHRPIVAKLQTITS